MTSHLVAVIGISGVGKTRLINRFVQRYPNFIHVSASSLIRDPSPSASAIGETNVQTTSERQLRLARSLEDLRQKNAEAAMLLDGHSVIDAGNQYLPVGVEVFRSAAVNGFIFIEDLPDNIWMRRMEDSARARPSRTIEALLEYQDIARATTREYSKILSIPLLLVKSGDLATFEAAISELISGGV